MTLLTGIAGAVTAAGVGGAQFFGEDIQDDYTTGWAIGGGLTTGVLSAIAIYHNGDERGQQASRRIGELEQAVREFTDSWNGALAAAQPKMKQPAATGGAAPPAAPEEPQDCAYAIQTNVTVPTTALSKENDELVWKSEPTKDTGAAKSKRCGLSPLDSATLSRQLNAITTKLMLVCGSNASLISATCSDEPKGVSAPTPAKAPKPPAKK